MVCKDIQTSIVTRLQRYPKGKHFNLITFTDVDSASSSDDRKSTSRETHFLGDCLVSQARKNFFLISLSTVEVEDIVAVTSCTYILQKKKTLRDMHVEYEEHLPIMVANTSVIRISKNLVLHSKTKHIPIKYHFRREQVVNKVVRLQYIFFKCTNCRHIH